MEKSTPSGRSYWDLLGRARRALAVGNLPVAEREYELALAARHQSPGRVFFTEKIVDGLSRLVKGKAEDPTSGRWDRRTDEFRLAFLDHGEKTVREAIRLAELRPEDNASTNQPVLEQALYLVGRSRLFSEEPSSAIPLLKGLFRTAGKTGQPFDVQLIRHDIPLTEEDRLWLARKGPDLLAEFVGAGALEPGSLESETWVQVILQLLHPRYFGSTSRLEEERAWLEAVTTDRLLRRPHDSIALYQAYLQVNSEPGPRPDEARIRLLELLANIDLVNFSVPRYGTAVQSIHGAQLAAGSAVSERYHLALERMGYRRPEPDPGTSGAAWASIGLEPDGRVAVVYWWKDEPRDVAFWNTGDDPAEMAAFLEPCVGRIVPNDVAVVEAIGVAWEDPPAPWPVQGFAAAFLEAKLPETGMDDPTLLKIGLGESGPWRRGWKPDLGHGLLDPPRQSALHETWQGGAASGALLGGLVWLSVVSRIVRTDPSLRAGIGEMARQGDPAADFLYGFLNLDQGLGQTLDSSFEPWTLPLLWTRPDPFGWSSGSVSQLPASGTADSEPQARPDLGRNDLAIVTTGDPGSVMTAWGDGSQKWRVVLDRLDRMQTLAPVASGAIGPVTLIPAAGLIHSLAGGLQLLDRLLKRESRPAGQVDGLLPLFHWLRLVETHNGDLLDFLQVRPRPGVSIPLFDGYRDLVADLELVAPVLDPSDDTDPWAAQFSQRVRKAGLVAGLADGLTGDASQLDSLWGVFEGSDASWVFLDSAAIHWHLACRQQVGIQDLHRLLHSRGHRHLSLLVGAVWMRSELEDLLGTWLEVFGSPYCLALTNLQPPMLRLVDRGIVPDAIHLAVQAHAQLVAQVTESIELAGSGTVLLPARGTHAELWRQIASGEVPLGQNNWHYVDPFKTTDTALPAMERTPEAKLLVVPILDSFSDEAVPVAQEDTAQAWSRVDQERTDYLLWRRRMCGLEIAGLLAGPWETVEILDCRWWRILVDNQYAFDQGTGRDQPWSGEAALAVAAPDGCRLFHLPSVGSGKGRTIHPNTLASVRHWLASRLGPALDPPTSGPLTSVNQRVVITREDAATVWALLAQPAALAWEKGQLDHWLLLVGDWVPPEGAPLVAAGYSPGISVWSDHRPSDRPAPILWCRTGDLEDPQLQTLIKRLPPAVVLALDIQDWLPTDVGSGQMGATALRVLLDSPSERLVLQTSGLAAPWTSFLGRETGAMVLDGEGPASVDSDVFPTDSNSPEMPPGGGPLFPDLGQANTPEVMVRRMRRLLQNLRPALRLMGSSEGDSPGDVSPSAGQLVPVQRLAVLAGLPARQISSGFRLLRWVARLSGDTLSNADGAETLAGPTPGSTARGHTLLIPRRYAEIEHQLDQLEQQLSVLFPLMLGKRKPGLLAWFDLEVPPVEMDPGQLALLDSLLSFWSRSACEDFGLIYECPRGTLNSTRRLVGTTDPATQVLARFRKALAIFRSRLNDVMGSSVETGQGFLVETGLGELRPEEEEFLALGASLGMWVWTGPPGEGVLHVVDLLTTAESNTVRSGTTGWTLLAEEWASRYGGSHEPVSWMDDELNLERDLEKRRPSGGLRSLWSGSGKADDLAGLTGKVASLARPESDPGLLVISGLAGTGRHQALAQGLHLAQEETGLLGEVTVYCPDAAAGAHFMTQLTAAGSWNQVPNLHVVGPGRSLPRSKRTGEIGEPGSDSILVMLEVHRFEPETRYQIAQLGRGRRLLITTDPVAATEPWEHLFLTVPRAKEIVRLEVQRTASRKVWSEVRQLLPDEYRGKGQSLGQGKGSIISVYAVNLDQCLARMVQEVEDGTLPQRLRLVGPLASDLDFLAASLWERGWLAVQEGELDALFLPGPREVLAATCEVLDAMGLLARFFPEDHIALGTDDQDPEPTIREKILSGYLGPEARSGLGSWRLKCAELDPQLTLGAFLLELENWAWARSVLAEDQAALRVKELLAPWLEVPLAHLLTHPLLEAWWYTARDELGLPVAIRRRPLVTMAASDQVSGSPVAAGVYLCLGTELPRQHYNVLSRLTENVLILYKEQSPLAVPGPG